MSSKLLKRPKTLEIDLKVENGVVYAYAPKYGLTVRGSDKKNAMAKMDEALKHIAARDSLASA